MITLLLCVFVAMGLALIVGGVIYRSHERDRELAAVLDLPFGERDVPDETIEQRAAIIDSTVGIANMVLEQFDGKNSLAKALERARIPVRPAEFVVIVGSFGIAAGAVLWLLTSEWYFAVAALVFSPLVARAVLNHKVTKRKKDFERQFPDALMLIAGSLSAGHTFLRAIQMMTEEAQPPISEEFARVIYETRLGDPLVDALERMALRLDIKDLAWTVQAIRVQQTVGGKLADLLHTLAEFIRAREEVRMEVNALTAEGRISAYVLGAMPPFLLLAMTVMNHKYIAPMFRGFGLVVLGGCAISVAIGVGLIFRMVKIEV